MVVSGPRIAGTLSLALLPATVTQCLHGMKEFWGGKENEGGQNDAVRSKMTSRSVFASNGDFNGYEYYWAEQSFQFASTSLFTPTLVFAETLCYIIIRFEVF